MNCISEVRRIKEEVEDDLLQIPGVVGVDVGRKIVNGVRTDTLAIRVHVTEKRDVPDDQRIPANIQGVPTDVIESRFVLHRAHAPEEE